MTADDPDRTTIRQIEFELEKAEHGMALPYDPERVGNLLPCWSRRASGNGPMPRQNAEEDWGKR